MHIQQMKSITVKSILCSAFVLTVISGLLLMPASIGAEDITATPIDTSITINEMDSPPHYATESDIQYIRQLQQPTLESYNMALSIAGTPSGTFHTPAEYEVTYGPMIKWGVYQPLQTEFIVGVTTDPAMDSLSFVLVDDASEQASAESTLSNAGADMDRIKFMEYPTNTVWIRDYGPIYISENEEPSIVDYTYNRNRPLDNGLSLWVGTPSTVPFPQDEAVYEMDLIHGGGNLMYFANGDAFMSTLIEEENTAKTRQEIVDEVNNYLNLNTTIYDRLPVEVDATGHIDMWFMPISDTEVIIGQFNSGSPGYAETEASAMDMINKGYTVYRTPSLNDGDGGIGGDHYTYTNSVIVNGRVFIPEYGGILTTNDKTALSVYQTAMPNHEIIQVDCAAIIPQAGAIHCIMKHVPAVPTPFVEILSPDGGELLEAGQNHEIKWIANDEGDISSVDIYYSTDGGSTYPNIIATGETHDGYYTWSVPAEAVSSACKIKIIAHDDDTNTNEDVSNADFTVTGPLNSTIYDFSREAGTIHRAYGTYSDSWNRDLNGNRTHGEFDTEVSDVAADAYADLAYSDAAGGDGDTNRYQNPDEGNRDESTMTCEFYISETPEEVSQLNVLWEGYGDANRHMELYIWDYSQGNWGDGQGNIGNENFTDDGK